MHQLQSDNSGFPVHVSSKERHKKYAGALTCVKAPAPNPKEKCDCQGMLWPLSLIFVAVEDPVPLLAL